MLLKSMTGAGVGGGNRRVKISPACKDPEDKMIINQIMLRFRPIAPRPVTVDGSISLVPVKEKRAKRKYVRVKKKTTTTKVKMMGEECNLTNFANLKMDDGKGCTSLNLTRTDPVPVRVQRVSVPEWIHFDTDRNNNIVTTWTPSSVGLHEVDLATTVARPRSVESWITVESVIGACDSDGRGWLMYSDEEILNDLETDRCPGFISNGDDEVQWVNPAYRRMVDPSGDDGGAPPSEVVVRLGVKVEKGAFEHWVGFSCRVSVVYVLSEKKKKKKKKRMTVPCDVRKMNSGGYAWRLDVEAALSLGRLS